MNHSMRIGLMGMLVGLMSVSALAQPPATQPEGRGRGRGGGGGGGASQYPFPYNLATEESIKAVLDRVYTYVDQNTASKLIDSTTNQPITDFSAPNPNAQADRGGFNITSYEWGVTYSGMVRLHQVTADDKYKNYVDSRYQYLTNLLKLYGEQFAPNRGGERGVGGGGGGRGGLGGGRGRGPAGTIRPLVNPATLDDCGAMASGMLEARLAGIGPDMMPVINTYMNHVSNGQMRLSDGTLARSRPHPETLWLDDLYMSVPALANMGKVTGDRKYYDDACRQILQFASRMFDHDKGLWLHGWSSNTDDHPAFYWARANGWAVMAMVELLDVLPEDHPQRAEVMKIYKAHIKGLAERQSGTGLWHQLLDRDETYLETSATAIFTYCIAKGINKGWLNAVTYGPLAQIGWQAVTTKVNAEGGVEGTCVGTDLAFDPTYYYYRPTSVTAAHGYGPVLLAGAEMLTMVKEKPFTFTFGVIHQATPRGGGPGGRGRGQ
jgi:rhamnogalacturonyl hydrolase YesR